MMEVWHSQTFHQELLGFCVESPGVDEQQALMSRRSQITESV